MIRFKHNILPVWFQFDGDEATLNRAKQSIVDDISMNGLSNYTGYADEFDEPTEEEKQWDGSPDFTVTLEPKEAVSEEPVKEDKTSKTTTKKGSKQPRLPMDKFAGVVGADTETPKKSQKTSS